MDDSIVRQLSRDVLELRELGDLEADIAIFPDGHYEVLGENSNNLTYGSSNPEEIYFDKIFKFRPILDRIFSKISSLKLPQDKEIKIIPVLYFLG